VHRHSWLRIGQVTSGLQQFCRLFGSLVLAISAISSLDVSHSLAAFVLRCSKDKAEVAVVVRVHALVSLLRRGVNCQSHWLWLQVL